MAKRIPNIISCSRIALSLALLFLINNPVFFVIVYIFCGLSDVADGYLARALGAETAVGSKLDSIGDLVFYAVWLLLLISFTDSKDYGLLIINIKFIAIVRLVNVIITKVKFKQWGIMHTTGNKLTGLVLFIVLPIYVFVNYIPSIFIVMVCMVAILSSIEESVILLTVKCYNANRKGIFRP